MSPNRLTSSTFPTARVVFLTTLAFSVFMAATAGAQPVGTFRWQVQPYCNVITVALTQNGGVYRLEGTDDRCGAGGTAASVIGTAFLNANGTIGLGLNVAAAGGEATQIDAAVTLPSASGTWRDSSGHSGAFVLTPGAGTGGALRPAAGPLGAASVDAAQVQLRVTGACPAGQYMQSVGQAGAVTCAAVAGSAGGTITGVAAGTGLTGGGTGGGVTLAVNPAVVQSRVSGACPAGQFMQSVGQGGTVACTSPPGGGGGTITSVTAGTGLVGGGTSGAVSIALPVTAQGALDLSDADGIVAIGATNGGGAMPSGIGTRFVWNPGKAALRAGHVSGTQWDSVNVGTYSMALGENNIASGTNSTAFGSANTASGGNSTAFGTISTASGYVSLAAGNGSVASGFASVAIGEAFASGAHSVALGTQASTAQNASGSFVYGDTSTAARITSSLPNQFLVRASGGVVFWSTSDTTYPAGPGVALYHGDGAWSSLSDVNAKENFLEWSGETVLRKIAQMPVREWNYKAQDATIRHMGPTAQDFYAAFGLGQDEHRINSIDADGVALAAVRALESRTRELQNKNAELTGALQRVRHEHAAVLERLTRLEQLLEKIGGRQ